MPKREDQVFASSRVTPLDPGQKITKLLDNKDDVVSDRQSRPLAPITPDPGKDYGEPLIRNQTPLAWGSLELGSASSSPCLSSSWPGNKTPLHHRFDSFAPGPEELALAPRKFSKKQKQLLVEGPDPDSGFLDGPNHALKFPEENSKPVSKFLEGSNIRESKPGVARVLNFDEFSEEDHLNGGYEALNEENLGTHVREFEEGCSNEENLLESIYKSLLDAIVSKQVEDLELTKNSGSPTPSILSDASNETCPPAPMKPRRQFRRRIIRKSLCKKLEF
ncbi:hypothetical protein AMTR_s00077p00177860 [Amborella trichopoda]|uniref:Uncharacterized protein n=2 Tax=Amborella trichopoda TaxID=13333 RepID=W1P9L1_AMBTC|nr:hypothetical protein AMTR_s00077p00177860 [Amborella trichopoda]